MRKIHWPLIMILPLALAACGGSDNTDPNPPESPATSSVTPTPPVVTPTPPVVTPPVTPPVVTPPVSVTPVIHCAPANISSSASTATNHIANVQPNSNACQ